MIRTQGLSVTAGGRRLLDDVTVEAPTGAVTGIVGPNGSGKTTLLRALLRATPLAAGSVSVDGHDLRHRSRRWIAQRIAVVGQRLDPDPSLCVADEVALGGLAARGVLRALGASFDDTVASALDAVGLTHRAADSLATLSGGELQRVALARALAHGADHVLLDEPTNHLDVRHRLEIVGLLRRIAPTVVIVLHDLELAARTCDHVVVLAAGHVVSAGPPAEALRPELLDTVYDVHTRVVADPDGHPHFSFSLPPAPAQASPVPERILLP
ncbi:ABC transporter ATP-binding protein [Cryobacterium soli]|uniref:ABC transporter ATP-binding protein n=1 Tax=Cryobacterium soli TaxID=2220095 RepID=UPI000E769BB4|nr:ABC transporter ATP-binding protein [Cryobacterium soli]